MAKSSNNTQTVQLIYFHQIKSSPGFAFIFSTFWLQKWKIADWADITHAHTRSFTWNQTRTNNKTLIRMKLYIRIENNKRFLFLGHFNDVRFSSILIQPSCCTECLVHISFYFSLLCDTMTDNTQPCLRTYVRDWRTKQQTFTSNVHTQLNFYFDSSSFNFVIFHRQISTVSRFSLSRSLSPALPTKLSPYFGTCFFLSCHTDRLFFVAFEKHAEICIYMHRRHACSFVPATHTQRETVIS